jgi:hypothetical protein
MFEKIRRQRRAIVFFAATYVLFGSAFFYLLFLTPGLDFVQEKADSGITVFLFNNSSHIIHDIRVETGTGEQVLLVESLNPKERALLPMEGRTGAVKLVAKAPFHATATKVFSFVEGNGGEEVKMGYKVTTPSLVFVDFNFVAEIEVCNQGDTLPKVSIVEIHGKTLFKEERRTETVSLEAGECKKIGFTLTPTRAAKTKIYFNVKALSYSKQIEKEITIEE